MMRWAFPLQRYIRGARRRRLGTVHGCGRAVLLLVAMLLPWLFPGCRGADDQPGTHKKTQSPVVALVAPGREIVDSVRVDLDMDGIDEFVITSRDPEGPAPPLPGTPTFDRLEIFTRDSAGRWESVFVDPVESGVNISFDDVNRTGSVQILVATDAGGNNPISARGLVIYGFRADDAFGILFFSQDGDPSLRDLDRDGIREVLVSGEYWGMMAHADMLTWTAAVHAWDGDVFAPANRRFSAFYDAAIAKRRTAYKALIRSRVADADKHAIDVHRAFAEWILWVSARGDLRDVARVWKDEQALLSAMLSDDQFDDLDTIVQELLAQPPPDAPSTHQRSVS